MQKGAEIGLCDYDPKFSNKYKGNLDFVGTLITNHIELNLVLNSDDFGMYDAMENIIALGWEVDTPEYQERLVFHYGETLESVKDKLYDRELEFEIKEIE